jgi:pyruvate dehydrogenase E1 component beta subunit
LDRDTIVESVKKTGRLVTVEDGFPFSGVGAEMIALINETGAFDYLRGPVQRVTAIDIPMPYAKNLEDTVVPKADTVLKAVQKVMKFN